MGVKRGYFIATLPGLILLLLRGVSPATADAWAPRIVGVILLALVGLAGVVGVVGVALLVVWASPKPRNPPSR